MLQGNYGGQYCPNGAHGPATDCFPSIFTGLQQAHAPGAVYAPGSNIDSADPGMLAAAVAAAQAADAVVAVLGLDQTHGRAWVGFTAATGADVWQTHDVLGWHFTSLREPSAV